MLTDVQQVQILQAHTVKLAQNESMEETSLSPPMVSFNDLLLCREKVTHHNAIHFATRFTGNS